MARENNYDLLRIISTIAVICIHVSARYAEAITDSTVFGICYLKNIGITCVYQALSRFAVPCFVMLSGAFDLADNKNIQFRYFYKKTFRKIGIPTIIFSGFYFLYSLIRSVYIYVATGIGGGGLSQHVICLKEHHFIICGIYIQ